MATTNPPAAETAVPHTDTIQHAHDGDAFASATQPATTTISAGKTSRPPTTETAALEPALPIAAEAKEKGTALRASIQKDEDVNPLDFQGEVLSNDELPSPEVISRIGEYIVLDRHGKSHTFKSLYTGRNVARRVLLIFVRHFFCGVSFQHSTCPYLTPFPPMTEG